MNFFNSLSMKNKLLVKFKDINKTFSIVQGQKMNFLKFRDEKQTFGKIQGPKQYFTKNLINNFTSQKTRTVYIYIYNRKSNI